MPDTFPEWQHRYEATRRSGRERVTVVAGLHYLMGNRRPYFSVTCSIEEQRRNGRWVEAGGGGAHETVARLWPELAPVIALHLADDTGEPMHAVDNGVYWLGAGDPAYAAEARDLATFQKELRLTDEETTAIDNYVTHDPGMASEALRFCLLGVRPRWRQEAADAVALLDDLNRAQADRTR